MVDLFDEVVTHNCDEDVIRNIVSIRESQDLFDDLSPSPEAWSAAQALEMAFKPHTHESHQPVIDRPFEEASYHDAIRFPFEHWAESRFSNGRYGVWYGADTLETTVHETVYHWLYGLLSDAGWEHLTGIKLERKIYQVHSQALLLDFRALVQHHPALVDPHSYRYTQQVGERIHREGHPGLLTRSARCQGDIYAIFSPTVLSNPRNHSYLTYTLEDKSVLVERTPGNPLLILPR